MKKLIIILLISFTVLSPVKSYSAQSAFHALVGWWLWQLIPEDFAWARPVVAFGSHIVVDRWVGEGYMGKYQMADGVLKIVAATVLMDESRRWEFFQAAMWANAPDAIDKGLNTSYFHFPENHLVDLDRDTTQIFETASVVLFAFKLEIPQKGK